MWSACTQQGWRAAGRRRRTAAYAKAEITAARVELRRLEELANERYIPPFDIARVHAQVGNREQALAGLEQAAKEEWYMGLALLTGC